MKGLLDTSLLLTDELADVQVEQVGLFPKGHVSLIVGEPGIGKTWIMLSIARSIASGSHGLGGVDMIYPKGRVLIFAGETGVRLLANRVRLMGGVSPLENVRVISSHLCAKMSVDVMVNTAIGRRNIDEAIRVFRPDLVFFDTMISFMSDGKDESSQVDMLDAIRGLSTIAAARNVALVLIHHFRKRQSGVVGNRSMDEVIGSSAFIRLASLVVGIERKEDVRVVRCLKSWWEEFSPFSFTITSHEGHVSLEQNYGYNRDGTYSVSKVAQGLKSAVLRVFGSEDFTIADVVGELGCSRSSATDAVSMLLREGKLEELPEKRMRASVYRVKGVNVNV